MNVQSLIIVALTMLLSLVRCAAVAPKAGTNAASVRLPQFVALLGSDQQNNITIELGIVNRETSPLETQAEIHAAWQLLDPDGSLRAGGALDHLPRLAPGEANFPIRWNDTLEPGHYTLVWGCSQSGMEQTGFQVIERQGKRVLLLDHP